LVQHNDSLVAKIPTTAVIWNKTWIDYEDVVSFGDGPARVNLLYAPTGQARVSGRRFLTANAWLAYENI
jgi:hypothetical protein